eukprot:3894117-Amphidinium_carterae.1
MAYCDEIETEKKQPTANTIQNPRKTKVLRALVYTKGIGALFVLSTERQRNVLLGKSTLEAKMDSIVTLLLVEAFCNGRSGQGPKMGYNPNTNHYILYSK